MIRVCKEESFHQRQGFEIMVSRGTATCGNRGIDELLAQFVLEKRLIFHLVELVAGAGSPCPAGRTIISTAPPPANPARSAAIAFCSSRTLRQRHHDLKTLALMEGFFLADADHARA